MTYAPQTLLETREYLQEKTGLEPNALGIVGSQSHTYGYHLGEDRLLPGDYSAMTPRDVAGLTNAAMALDIGNFSRLVELVAWTVTEARAGRTPDLRGVIGPAADGRAYRYDHLNGWKPEQRAPGDSHEWHGHYEWYRDSENRPKVDMFQRFFAEPIDPGLPEPPPVGTKISVPWGYNLYDWTSEVSRGYNTPYDLNIMRALNPGIGTYIRWLPAAPGTDYKIPVFWKPTPPVRIR